MSKQHGFIIRWDGKDAWSPWAKWDRDLGTWVHHLVTDDRHLYEHATPVPQDYEDLLFSLRTASRARAQP